jgi:hypothetical protein
VTATALPGAEKREFLPLVYSHLDNLARHGTDRYGPHKTAMWMASLDLATKSYPESQPMARAGRRVYRDIASPFGSSIYWDLPQLSAAYNATRLSGKPQYGASADRYIDDFLARGVDAGGVFEWGNHRFYDAYKDQPAHFAGGVHEMRPIPPCWEVFWKRNPAVTEREIRESARRHLFDPATGGFNRHDDGKSGHAFIESGGILAESLCWLYARKKESGLADVALKIATFSHSHRGSKTGLIENDATSTRWDKLVSTTEVGLWAGSLLRCADLSGRPEFARMAGDGVTAFLRYGYDSKTRRYFGQVRVADGTPVLKDNPIPGPEEYWPGNHADIWNANFPAHDYPMAMADTCVELFRRTKGSQYGEAIERFSGAIDEQLPVPRGAKNGRGGYAELFGRAIHFLLRAADVTGERRYRAKAASLAAEARDVLYTEGMFRGHAGEDRYDAVDGVGYLLLALLYLDTGKRPDYFGFGF